MFEPTGAALEGGDGGRGAGFFSVALNIFLYCEMCSMFMCLHVNRGGKFNSTVITLIRGMGSYRWPEVCRLSFQSNMTAADFYWQRHFSQEGRVSHLWNQLLWCLWSKQTTCRLIVDRLPFPDTRCWLSAAGHFVRNVLIPGAAASGQKRFISCPDCDPSPWGEVRSAASRLRAPAGT